MDTPIAELIKALDVFDGSYKRDEVDAAITRKEEITPHLLAILEDVVRDPAGYAEEEHFANIYAAILLAHFKEPAAHLPIIRAFCIADAQREDLWGDMVTATLPALLYQTCNGSFSVIKELAGNKEVYVYVRGAALEALTYAVAFGQLRREEVIEYFLGLFTGEEADKDSYFWSHLVTLICDLHPQGTMDEIRRAFEEGLVSPGYVRIEEVEKECRRDREDVLAELRLHAERSVSADIHDYCSWFACFSEGQDTSMSLPEPAVASSRGKKSEKTSRNRKKNKIARQSRKKNKG
jgi:hypothetical protein